MLEETNRRGESGAGATAVTEQSVLLVRYRAGVTGQAARTVHLVPIPSGCEAGAVGALCGGLLRLDEIETVGPGQGVPCTACVVNRAATGIATGAPVVDCHSPDGELLGGPAYYAWGWPVTEHRDLIQLMLDCDASAIAIPIPLCAEVTRVLTARHCAPAVLAHPYAPEHHMVLTGEKFGAALPWPAGVYQVTGALMLPPTRTICGPITWVQPPSKDSLRLSREIDVFGALRSVVSD